MAKQRKKIAQPWIVELDSAYKSDIFIINLINNETGEIRQKRVTLDQIARKLFESEISNWDDVKLEDI